MSSHTPDSDAWESRTARNTLGLAAWTIAWVASLALAAFGPEFLWNDESAPTLVAIAFNVAVGIGLLLAYKRYLQALDELQREIQLQAMAWSLGAGLIGGTAWTLFITLDVVAFEAEIAHLTMFMSAVYLVAIVAGMLRYR